MSENSRIEIGKLGGWRISSKLIVSYAYPIEGVWTLLIKKTNINENTLGPYAVESWIYQRLIMIAMVLNIPHRR